MKIVMDMILAEVKLPKADAEIDHPAGVVVTDRGGYRFVQNYSGKPQRVRLHCPMQDQISHKRIEGEWTMPVNGILILKKDS